MKILNLTSKNADNIYQIINSGDVKTLEYISEMYIYLVKVLIIFKRF